MKSKTLVVGIFVLLTSFFNQGHASTERATNLTPVNYADVHHSRKHYFNHGYSRYTPRFYKYFKPRHYGYNRYKHRGYGRHSYRHGYRGRHYRYW